MKSFLQILKKAGILTAALLILCSIVYPLALTGVGQLAFNRQANGNLIEVDGKAVGSELVGQDFTDSKYFKGRISSVNYNTYTEEDMVADEEGNTNYGGVSSGSFNYGATNPELEERVKQDLADFLAANPDVREEEIPADLLTASGSGLDPHISPQAAEVQIPGVAKASGLDEEQLREMVKKNTEHKVLGMFGEDKVNVLKVNIEIAKAIEVL